MCCDANFRVSSSPLRNQHRSEFILERTWNAWKPHPTNWIEVSGFTQCLILNIKPCHYVTSCLHLHHRVIGLRGLPALNRRHHDSTGLHKWLQLKHSAVDMTDIWSLKVKINEYTTNSYCSTHAKHKSRWLLLPLNMHYLQPNQMYKLFFFFLRNI